MSFSLTGNDDNAFYLAIIIPIIVLLLLTAVITVVIFVTKKRLMPHLFKNRLYFDFQCPVLFFHCFHVCFLSGIVTG